MGERPPIVLNAGKLQQMQPGDTTPKETLPYDQGEDNQRRLFRVLLMDLMKIGFPLSQELIDEASKQG